MPDAFLRSVIARREAEQFGAHTDAERMAYLDEATRRRRCRVCGELVQHWEDEDRHGRLRSPACVCTACGGRKRQAKLEREDRAREAEVQRIRSAEEQLHRRRAGLLRLVGIHPTTEVPMSPPHDHDHPTRRTCSTEGCDTLLRRDNETGVCTRCRKNRRGELDAKAAPNTGVKKRFRVLCDALGEDPDELIEDFMQSWLDKAKSAVKRSIDEAA